MKLLYGHDQAVSEWVSRNIAYLNGQPFGPCSAIGVQSSDGDLMAGVVFHDYQPKFRTMQVSMAAVTPKWATKNIVRLILSYPFLRCGVNKVWVACAHTNVRPIRFCKGLGFTQEAVLAYQFDSAHAVILRMLRKDYLKTYEVDPNGQIGTLAATGT